MKVIADNRYKLVPVGNFVNTSELIVYTNGTFGTAICNIQYADADGLFIDIQDGLLENNTQNVYTKGKGVTLYLNVVGSDVTTNINITVAGV